MRDAFCPLWITDDKPPVTLLAVPRIPVNRWYETRALIIERDDRGAHMRLKLKWRAAIRKRGGANDVSSPKR